MQRVFSFLFLLFICKSVHSQEKFALLIGISEYAPQANAGITSEKFKNRYIPNLDGPVNDVRAMESVLISRFGFSDKRIKKIINQQASRNAILSSLNELLGSIKKDDVVFVFYAGHGSQVKNSLSAEPDKLDETIVPADSWKEGVKDIRDKELAPIFINLLKKGARLTVMFDCCHSGSLAKGSTVGYLPITRSAKPDAEDIKDPYQPPAYSTLPGADYLFISASQDNEPAEELKKDFSYQGALTYAFCNALEQLSSLASSDILFQYIRSVLKSERLWQEPSISMSPSRRERSFLGLTTASASNQFLIPVSGVEGSKVYIQGGYAVGLSADAELIRVEKGDTCVLVIDSVLGPASSIARLKKGRVETIRPGSFFEMGSMPSVPLLYIYIPGSKSTGVPEINKSFAVALSTKLKANNLLKESPTFEQADYYLSAAGVQGTGQVVYTLRSVRNDMNDKLLSMPLHTKEIALEDHSPENIVAGVTGVYQAALGLAKLKGWIQLAPPSDKNSTPPFHLELADRQGKVRPDFAASIGERMSLHLVLDETYTAGEYANKETEWYYYLFTVDSRGRMRLFRPDPKDGHPCASEINRIIKDDYKVKRKTLINFPVTEPIGIDYFFLLFTNRQISNCGQAFNQTGVEASFTKDGDLLSNLLNLGNENFKLRDVLNSEKWGLLKMGVTTIHN